MENMSITLIKDQWVSIAANVDYLMQNRSKHGVLVKAQATATAPTTIAGAFEVLPGELVGSGILSGYIYALCNKDTVSVVVAK